MMTKAQRKRRAARGALALLEWRDRMHREEAAREEAERETMVRYETMVAAMRRQAEDAAQRRRWRSGVREDDLPAVSHASHYS
jgi:hypothetical protein